MDYKDFVKSMHATILRENRGAVKLSSKEKRAQRREHRYKSARVKERNIHQARKVRELRSEYELKRAHELLASTAEDERSE